LTVQAELDGVAAARGRRAWAGLASAVTFLTVVPLPRPVAVDVATGSGAAWFPLVGAGIGAAVGGVRLACEPLLGRTVATVLAMIALVVLTGALHQDGLADTADGLGAPGDRSRRLAVMRDSSTGAFGTLALVLWALLLFTVLASLSGARTLRAMIAAAALARGAALVHATGAPPARPDGLGSGFGVTRQALVVASFCAIVVALASCAPAAGGIAVGVAAITAGLSVAFARRTLGGRTGDTLGATVALAEVAVCAALMAFWRG
jgi:adenosylcobinamide-GDP ribazoletransferase